MPVGLYADHHLPRSIVVGLRLRGVDVLTAQEDGRAEASDLSLLTRSVELGRVMVTQDQDFLVLADTWLAEGRRFAGIVFAHQLRVTIGQCVQDLELIGSLAEPTELEDQVVYLPF